MADKKSKRVSMQGMGADAFFGLPVEKTEQEETIEEEQLPAKQDTSTPASQEAIQPVKQESAMPVTPYTALPVSQQSRTPAKQDLIKATYYIRPEQDIKLEQIRLQR